MGADGFRIAAATDIASRLGQSSTSSNSVGCANRGAQAAGLKSCVDHAYTLACRLAARTLRLGVNAAAWRGHCGLARTLRLGEGTGIRGAILRLCELDEETALRVRWAVPHQFRGAS